MSCQNAKDALSCLQIGSGIVMHDVRDTNYERCIVESLLQFSEPKRYKFHAKVETSCQTVQNVE